jgi:nickel/cobalt exporter
VSRPAARRGATPRPSLPRRWRWRLAVLAALVAVALAAGAAPAAAHPLGNFTLNTYAGLRVGPDRLVVDYVLDMAEIPTFQARQAIDADHDGRVAAAEADRWRDRECPRLAAGLRASVDGQALSLGVTGSALRFPGGAGGLATLRLECALAACLPAATAAGRALAYADANLQGRVGWHEIIAVGDRATLDGADVPATSTTGRLTVYPADQLSSPLDQRSATLRFHPGGPPAPAHEGPSAGDPARGNPASGCEAPRRGSLAGGGAGCPGCPHPRRPGCAGAGSTGSRRRSLGWSGNGRARPGSRWWRCCWRWRWGRRTRWRPGTARR